MGQINFQVISFLFSNLKFWKVSCLISVGIEFHILAPQYLKDFWKRAVANLRM